MKTTMKNTVNSYLTKAGHACGTTSLEAEFASSARELASGKAFISPLERVKLNVSAGVHWVSTSEHDEEEKALFHEKGIIQAGSDGFMSNEVYSFDKDGNLVLKETGWEEAIWAYAGDEVKLHTSLKAVAKGLFSQVREGILTALVENGKVSFNEMVSAFRRAQGFWGHCNKLPKDLCKEVASYCKEVGLGSNKASRKAFAELNKLNRELC